MNERSIELEELFDIKDNENEIEINEEEDYLKYNNFRHKEIRRTQKKFILKKNEENIEKKAVKKEIKLEEKSADKKQEIQKKKHLLFKLSNFELFVLSLFKKVKWLRENKMIYQIMLIYFISFIMLLLFIIFAKNYIVEKSFVYFEDNNYYTFVDSDVIRTQKVLKLQTDKKNNNNLLSMQDEHLLFMELYTKELIRHNLLIKDGIFRNLNNSEIQTYGAELGIKFETTSTLEELIKEDIDDNNHVYNIKNLLPFYYHFVPIINQNLEFFGVRIINFYFIGNDNKCGQENSKINNLYFKYPLEKTNLGADIIPLNNKIYDYIIDPFIDCNNGYKFSSEFIEFVKENNWYSNIIKENKNIEIDFRIFKLMKINQENKREDYFIAYNKFNMKIEGLDTIINFLFAIRFSREDLLIPFLFYNEYNDTLLYDYLTIMNFEQVVKQVNLSNFDDKNKIIYDNEYNIDDSKNLLLKNTKFIKNINFFGMQKKEESSTLRTLKNYENNKLYSDNSIMIKYEELNDIQKNYKINYYYNPDILFYKILYFSNQFILYKKKHPEYLISDNIITNINNSIFDINNDSLTLSEDHPCSISNIDEYYQNIKNKFGYDCIYDYCFFHDCFWLDNLNIYRNNYHFPNCYCIPLFCKDEKTQKNSEFEKQIRKKMKIKNNEKFDYSFTSKNDYYLSEKQNTFATVDDFFNRTNFNFKCQITFNKKNVEENRTFITNIFSYDYMENEKNTFLLLFIYNSVKLEQIMKEMHLNLFNILKNIVTAYSILFAILFIFILCYLNIACKRIIDKMNQIKNIRKILISKSKGLSKNNNNLEKILIKEKSSQKSHNINEKNNLIDKNNNKNKNDSNENEEDEDELDELIKLINNNLSLFNIEFNLNEESNYYLNDIKKQYKEIIQVNKFKNRLLLKEEKEEKEEIILNNTFENNNIIDINNNSSINIKKNMKTDDLSVNILCELLSLSNNKIDFSNIKTNFYYNIINDNSLYDLNKHIFTSNEANIMNESNEITNIDKLQNALEHYFDNIHEFWKKYYDYQKSKEEI